MVQGEEAGQLGAVGSELIEARSEVLELHAQLRRTEEERDILKTAARYFASQPESKYQFIIEHRHQFKVATMCRVLWTARSGLYAWVQNFLSDRALERLGGC